MNKEQMLAWVESASYEDLMRLRRFEPVGSPWFVTDEVYAAIQTRMALLYTPEEHTRASKAIGY